MLPVLGEHDMALNIFRQARHTVRDNLAFQYQVTRRHAEVHRAILPCRCLRNGVIVDELEVASSTAAPLFRIHVKFWPRSLGHFFLFAPPDEPAHVVLYVFGHHVNYVRHTDRLGNMDDEINEEDYAGDGQQHRYCYVQGRNIFFFPITARLHRT